MKKLFLLFIAVIIYNSANAQQTLVHSHISSFGEYDLHGKYVYIIPGDPNIDIDDIEFQYYKDVLKQGFIRCKAIPTEDVNMADLCILLDYAITDESYVGVFSTPVWGNTGVKSVITNSTTTGSAYGSGIANGYGNMVVANGSVNGSSATSTTQRYSYEQGITGYKQNSKKVSEFKRVANVYAYDNKVRTEKPKLLWKTNIESEGSSNDLESIFCNLVDAGIAYFGKPSIGKKEIATFANSPDAIYMKNKLFLKDNVIVNPINHSKGTLENVVFRSMIIEPGYTTLMFYLVKNNFSKVLNDPVLGEKKMKIKIPATTYLIYHGDKIPVEKVTKDEADLIGQTISFGQGEHPIWLFFPIEIKKGDTFSIVSYKDKKEKEILFEYRDVVAQ